MSKRKSVVEGEIEKIEKEVLMYRYQTALKKTQFVNELKNGLGEAIKKNPNGHIVYKKSFSEKFFNFLKKIFTKF